MNKIEDGERMSKINIDFKRSINERGFNLNNTNNSASPRKHNNVTTVLSRTRRFDDDDNSNIFDEYDQHHSAYRKSPNVDPLNTDMSSFRNPSNGFDKGNVDYFDNYKRSYSNNSSSSMLKGSLLVQCSS